MRGITRAQPRLSAARAFFAGAAILAGAATTPSSACAQERTKDTAMAVPRLAVPGPGGAGELPRPLAAAAARLVRSAFANPTVPVDAIEGTGLAGHVLAERLLGGASRASAEELRGWLARYADLADAPAVHALLLTRLPHGAAMPAAPVLPGFVPAPGGDDVEAGGRLLPRNPVLDRAVREATRAGQFERAERLIAGTKGLAAPYGALLRAEVAHAMFSQGLDLRALALAEAAHAVGHGAVGLGPWVAGLAAWRLGRTDLARTWFVAAYRAPLTAPGQRAAAAFWAGRANLLVAGEYGPWLHRAAHDPRTFYGLLARHMLGQAIPKPGAPQDTLGAADIEAVGATVRGGRAFALLQVGKPQRAAAELRLLWTEMREQPGFSRSVLLVAVAAGLQELAGQLDAVMQPAVVRLPATRLRPAGGFRLDPALVYALARLESNFDATAVSPRGARGLMQIMPATAAFILAGTGRPAPQLLDPATNLELGQRLLLQLTQYEAVGPDLIRALAAYNAGTGTLGRWVEAMPRGDDPLLFMAALPGEEARAYVPRALAYSWLYAAQLGLASSSLDELAAGRWPAVPVRTPLPVVARLH